jgi:hypothetical protein
VTTVKNLETSMTCPSDVPVVRLEAGREGVQGSGLSVATRNRASIAPMAAVTGAVVLPTTDVVDAQGFAVYRGIRSWSPPV